MIEPAVSPEPLLAVRKVTIAFGGVRAVDGLDFDLQPGSVVSLIGPNGAGKTTVLNSISGFVRAQGSIRFKGVELLGKGAHRRAALGIGRTFQNLELFRSMTVLDNVLTGQHASLGGNLLFDLFGFPAAAQERPGTERATAILSLLGLQRYAQRRADELPFGLEKLVGLARALAAGPQLLLLDEPAAGLTLQELSGLGDLVLRLRQELGLAILLVEHNMRLVMSVSDRVVVLDGGCKLAEGAPLEVSQNRAVVEAYLGATPAPAIAREVQDELAQGS